MKIGVSWVGQSTNLCRDPDKGSPWLRRCFCKFWRFCWSRCCSSCCCSATWIWSILDGDAECAENHEEMMMMTMMIGANNGKVQSILWRWHDAVAAMILMKTCLSWRRCESKVLGEACPLVHAPQPFSKIKIISKQIDVQYKLVLSLTFSWSPAQ